ncbi:MAG: 16S rRNA (cytidine(1402)-2'-O)-methyltransferase [Acidaminococcaceae bacterium]|nr:16S rRNA (cytidine(1402)-2'-O)-methyltransferase [Acidaminococcaceae bacterium]
MICQSSFGTLYLVGTPIGNLGDMSPRALEVLRSADLVAAEDTRHTLELLNHFGIKKRLVRYDEHTKVAQGDFLLGELQSGRKVALVSDAGLPGIADPGADLAKKCISRGIVVVPVPGPNAALTALIASGLSTQPFHFVGFLPKTGKKRREEIERLADVAATLIFYEAPHRVKEVVGDLAKHFAKRRCCLARELTKVHEEFWRGTVAEALEHLEGQEQIRGEFVLLVAPPESVDNSDKNMDYLVDNAKNLLDNGYSVKDAAAEVAAKYKVSKREIYNELIKKQREE